MLSKLSKLNKLDIVHSMFSQLLDMTKQKVQHNCDKVPETYDKARFCDSARTGTIWLCNVPSISTEEVHKNLFYKMTEGGSLPLPFYNVSGIYHRVVRSADSGSRAVSDNIYEK